MDAVNRGAGCEVRLLRDLAVLTTLAHVGCAMFHHLHDLCFPGCAVATARVSLQNLTAAGYLAHSPWLLKQSHAGKGQVWTITAKGYGRLSHYITPLDTAPDIDLSCPSTALEYDAWQARMQVRTLIVALVLEARRSPLFASLRVALSDPWPTAVMHERERQPDGTLQIDWQSPATKRSDWLPWWTTPPLSEPVAQYAVYLDRTGGMPPLLWLEDKRCQSPAMGECIPILILNSEERFSIVQQAIVAMNHHGPIRWSTWQELSLGIGAGRWRDNHGRACSLQL